MLGIVDGTVDGIVDGILDDTIDINNHYTTNIGTIHHADIDDNSFDELTVKDPYFGPSKINDDFVDYCNKKGPSFFQNKQKSYTQSHALVVNIVLNHYLFLLLLLVKFF